MEELKRRLPGKTVVSKQSGLRHGQRDGASSCLAVSKGMDLGCSEGLQGSN